MIAAVEAQATGKSVQPNLFVGIADGRYRDHHLQPFRDGPGGAHRHSDDPCRRDGGRLAPGVDSGRRRATKPGTTRPARTARTPTVRAAPVTISTSCASSARRAVTCWSRQRRRSGASTQARSMRSITGSTIPPAADPSTSARWSMRPPTSRCRGRWRAEAQGSVAVEVHRPRHAGGRQLRHEHRGRQLRRRRHHSGDEDRRRARAPVYRGKVKSFDATEALAVQGVEKVVEIPALPDDAPAEFHAMGGVAVVGTNTWSVLEGRKKLVIEWDDGPNAPTIRATYDDKLRAAARTAATSSATAETSMEPLRGRQGAGGGVLRAVLHHTPMEPPAALVDANVRRSGSSPLPSRPTRPGSTSRRRSGSRRPTSNAR